MAEDVPLLVSTPDSRDCENAKTQSRPPSRSRKEVAKESLWCFFALFAVPKLMKLEDHSAIGIGIGNGIGMGIGIDKGRNCLIIDLG